MVRNRHPRRKGGKEMSKHYEITTKEVGREKPIKTSFIGDRDRKYIIDFFGLEQPDVEWYKIELKEDKK